MISFSRKFLLTLVFSSFVLAVIPATGQAITCGPGFTQSGNLCIVENQSGGGGIASETNGIKLITTIITYLLFFAGAIAVLFIVIGGFRYMTAGANPENSKKARSSVVNAVIGLILIILSYAIVLAINTTLNKG